MAGYRDAQGAPMKIGTFLAYTNGGSDFNIIPVMISNTARDASNVGNTTFLREGLVLAKITSGPEAGKYKEYQAGLLDGSQLAVDCVILWNDVEIATPNADIVVPVLSSGHVKKGLLIFAVPADAAGFAYADVQRLQTVGTP